MSDVIYWIWLAMTLDYAPRSLKTLLEKFKCARAVYEADADLYEGITGLSAREKEHLAIKDLSAAEEIATYCLQSGIHVIPYTSEEYPNMLRDIADPPAVLYLRGTMPMWNTKLCIGVIGTRAMTYYGAECTLDIAYDLARMGCITVSGMALGVDGMCAASTMQAGGSTVAVLGSGVDVIYPPEHYFLSECILKNGGAIISEFAPHERPEKIHFPIRNRIISGLSKAVIVVEGEAGSGSLITARRAAAQGRTVFAIPGHIGRVNSEGTLLLLKHKKAVPLTCADDIYDAYRDEYLPHLNAFNLLQSRDADVEHVMFKYRISCAKSKKKMSPSVEREIEEANKPKGLIKTAFDKLKNWTKEPKDPEDIEKKLEERSQKEISEKEFALMRKMSDDEQKIYKQMPYGEEVQPDAIVLGDMTPDDIIGILTEMELEGFVASTSGGKYTKLLE